VCVCVYVHTCVVFVVMQVINMGGEMLYILQQRLQAQKIPDEKSARGVCVCICMCVCVLILNVHTYTHTQHTHTHTHTHTLH